MPESVGYRVNVNVPGSSMPSNHHLDWIDSNTIACVFRDKLVKKVRCGQLRLMTHANVSQVSHFSGPPING